MLVDSALQLFEALKILKLMPLLLTEVPLLLTGVLLLLTEVLLLRLWEFAAGCLMRLKADHQRQQLIGSQLVRCWFRMMTALGPDCPWPH